MKTISVIQAVALVLIAVVGTVAGPLESAGALLP